MERRRAGQWPESATAFRPRLALCESSGPTTGCGSLSYLTACIATASRVLPAVPYLKHAHCPETSRTTYSRRSGSPRAPVRAQGGVLRRARRRRVVWRPAVLQRAGWARVQCQVWHIGISAPATLMLKNLSILSVVFTLLTGNFMLSFYL